MNPLFGRLRNKLTRERFSAGLDIGTQALKLVKLKFSDGNVELCNFCIEPNYGEASGFLAKIKDAQGIDAVNMGLCGPKTVIRYVSFPDMEESELKQALKFEAQKHIPFSIEEVNLDAYILKHNLPENKMQVLLVAAKKELVAERLKAAENASLRTGVIDLDCLALANAFIFNNPADSAVALLNIGESFTNLTILEKDLPVFSRDIHIAGNLLTQKIADMFAIDLKSAKELKLHPDNERMPKITLAAESVMAGLVAEIRTSFDYYESQGVSSVAKIFLSGGTVNMPGLKESLGSSLGIEAELWDPLKKINIASGINTGELKVASLQLAVAVGLALRS